MKHWTQTPEGKEKMARIQQARWRKRRNHAKVAENNDGNLRSDLDSYKEGYRAGFADGRRAAGENN